MKRFVKWLGLLALIICIGLPVFFRVAAMVRETDPVEAVLPAEGRLIATGSGDIFVQELGPKDATPVLLAHGTAAWSGLWRETMQALADAGFRAIAFDMPPFGFSQRDAGGDYARVTQARRILDLARALEIKPVLAAHSFGASAGMEAALTAPQAFSGLVIINGAIGLGSATGKPLMWPISNETIRPFLVSATGTNPMLTKTFLTQMVHRKDQVSQTHVDILQRPMSRDSTTQAMSHWVPSLLAAPADALSTSPENYAGFDLQTALIWGDRDTVTPLEQGQELASVIQDSTLIILKDVGHIPQIEDPAGFQAALLQALALFSD